LWRGNGKREVFRRRGGGGRAALAFVGRALTFTVIRSLSLTFATLICRNLPRENQRQTDEDLLEPLEASDCRKRFLETSGELLS
jgi:hypothetical protein